MNDDKFVATYDQLMARLYKTMNDTLHSVADALAIAKKQINNGLTQEEINEVAGFLMRDVELATRTDMNVKNNDSLTEWLRFDIALLENFALDAFSGIADKTRIELAKLENQAHQHQNHQNYQSDEITAPGTFHCQKCHKQIAFKSTSRLPQCPRCQTKTFSRH